MKPLYFGTRNSGVDIQYNRSRREVAIGGWYDSMVGIEGRTVPLADLLRDLGVKPADLRRVLREWEDVARGETPV